MKIERTFYRFACPVCHNALRANPEDLKFGKFTIGFTCPVCEKERRVLKVQAATTTINTYSK